MSNQQDKPQKLGASHQRALDQFDHLPDTASVRLPVVQAIFSVSPATVWRWTKEGTLPGFRKVRGCAMWQVGEIRRLLKAHAAKA